MVTLPKSSADTIKTLLLNAAHARFGTKKIFPCGNRSTLADCYTFDRIPNTRIILALFWYNVLGERTTKMESLKLRCHKPLKGPEESSVLWCTNTELISKAFAQSA